MECRQNGDGTYTVVPDPGYDVAALIMAQHNPDTKVTAYQHGSRLVDDGSMFFVFNGMANYAVDILQLMKNPLATPPKDVVGDAQDS